MAYFIKRITFASGERFVNLVDENGIPLFLPTIWLLTSYRGRGLAFNTIFQAVQSIEVLYAYLASRGITLSERLKQGLLLTNQELEGLLGFLKMPVEQIRNQTKDTDQKVISNSKLKESMRMRSSKPPKEISPNTALTRINFVREYLDYCCNHQSYQTNNIESCLEALKETKNQLQVYLKHRAPKFQKSPYQKLGLTKEAQDQINNLIQVNSSLNPWVNEKTRERNFLIVRFLLETGMRRGEMLNVMVSDIDFRTHTVKVVRRPDNPQDPRINQPVVKTLSREIPVSEKLCLVIREYIRTNRNKGLLAKKHGFLFTSTTDGSPLTINGLNKIFRVIKDSSPQIKEQISPHILRHTWNDNFSDYCDVHKINSSEEERIRNSLMGWSPFSKMASTYTRRHTQEAAKKISEGMQKGYWESLQNE